MRSVTETKIWLTKASVATKPMLFGVYKKCSYDRQLALLMLFIRKFLTWVSFTLTLSILFIFRLFFLYILERVTCVTHDDTPPS